MKIERENYTLYCGDCLDIMKGLEQVDAVIADPPYGIDYQSAWRIEEKRKPKIANDAEPFLGWAGSLYKITKPTSPIYIFYRWDKQDAFYNHVSGYFAVKSQIIWDKVIHGMGDLNGEYAPQHENILFATREDFSFHGNRPKSIIKQRRVLPDDLLHPNEKPVPLLRKLIRDCTRAGDIVLDFTMGSGTTGVACGMENRKFIGIEIDPDYFEIARKRIETAYAQKVMF